MALSMLFAGCNGKSDKDKKDGIEKAIERYIQVEYGYNGSSTEDNIRPLGPESMWKRWAYHEGYDSADDMLREWDEQYKGYLKEIDHEINVDYEITQKKELPEKELQEICENLEERYETDYSDFTQGYEITIEMHGETVSTYRGETRQKEVDDEITVFAVKLDGKWYLATGGAWLIDRII